MGTVKSDMTYNREAEKAVLGAIFLSSESIQKARQLIQGSDFYSPAHEKIFTVMSDSYDRGIPIDLMTITNELKKLGQLETVGGGAYLYDLVEYVPTSANIDYYCRAVKDTATRRKLIREAQHLLVQANSPVVTVDELLTKAKDAILSVSDGAYDNSAASDLLSFEVRADRYMLYVNSLERKRFKTGYNLIDKEIRGVAPGEVLTVIAYSGTYKSAFLQNLLLNNAENTGSYQLFFSLEMPVEKVFEREAQILAGKSGFSVETGYRAMAHEAYDIHRTMIGRGSEKLLVCEKSRLSIDKIARYVDIARHKYGDIGAVGIDYLGLIQAPGKSVFDKVSHVSTELKNMAKDLHVPVIVLCQVNRGYSNSKKVEIEMDAAKGGGDIEAGADFMLGMWLEKGELLAKLLKNRNGKVGISWQVEVNRETLKFISLSPRKNDTEGAMNRMNVDKDCPY